MKTYIITIIIALFSTLAYSQEMEAIIFNTNDIHLNLMPDSLDGSSEINLHRNGDFNHALINFEYRNDPYIFTEDLISGGLSQWNVGVTSQSEETGDFIIRNYDLDFDIVRTRDDFTIRSSNGYVGLGAYFEAPPTARLDIEHISPNTSEPALIIGSDCTSCGYMEVHKPKFDQSTRVATWSHNGTWAARVNDNGSFYRFQVNGNVYSSTGNYYGPIIFLSPKSTNKKSAVANLDKLDLVMSNEKSTQGTYGLGADGLAKAFPTLVQMGTNEYGSETPTGVNYVGLVPVLVAAHQETKHQLDNANQEIAELKERLSSIEALLEK